MATQVDLARRRVYGMPSSVLNRKIASSIKAYHKTLNADDEPAA